MEPRLIETVNGFTIRLHNAGTSSAYYLAKRGSTVFTGKSLNYVRKQCQSRPPEVKASMTDVESLSDDDLKERYNGARSRLEKAKKERASDIDAARKEWFTLQGEMKRRKFPTGRWLSMSTLYPELPADLQSMSDKELDNAYMENRRAVTRARNNLGSQDPTTRRLTKQSAKFLAEVRRRNVRGVSASTLSMSRRAAYLRKKYSKNVQASSKTVAANRLAEDNARLQELLKKVPEFDRSMFKDIDSGRYPVSEVAKDLIADGASPEAANEFARFLAEKTKRYNIRHEKFVTDFDMSTSKASLMNRTLRQRRPRQPTYAAAAPALVGQLVFTVAKAAAAALIADLARKIGAKAKVIGSKGASGSRVQVQFEKTPENQRVVQQVARKHAATVTMSRPTISASSAALTGQLVFTVAVDAAKAFISDVKRKLGAKVQVIGSKGANKSRVQVQFEKTPENKKAVSQLARQHKAALAMSSTDSTASTYMISWKAEEPQLLALLKQFKLKANVVQKGRHPYDEISIKVSGPKSMIKAAWRKALDKKLVSDSDLLKWSMSMSRAERYALSLAKKKTMAFSAGDPNLSRLDRACRRIMKAAQGINMDAKAEQAVAYGSDRPVSAGLVQQLEKFAEAIQILERKFPDRDSR